LKFAIGRFRQDIDAHLRSHLDRATLRLVLLASIERFTIVAETPAAPGALSGAVAERVMPRLFVVPDHVRLAACRLHFMERAERIRIVLQPRFHVGPRDPLMPGLVLLEA